MICRVNWSVVGNPEASIVQHRTGIWDQPQGLGMFNRKGEPTRAEHLCLFCQDHMHRVVSGNVFVAGVAERSHVNADE